jgi:hypothetical protein
MRDLDIEGGHWDSCGVTPLEAKVLTVVEASESTPSRFSHPSREPVDRVIKKRLAGPQGDDLLDRLGLVFLKLVQGRRGYADTHMEARVLLTELLAEGRRKADESVGWRCHPAFENRV